MRNQKDSCKIDKNDNYKKTKILQESLSSETLLKVIKITTKSDLDKDHYLIFPPITKNHYYIRTPSGTWNQNKGSYCTPRTPARVANVQKYHLEQWFSIYGQFTHFG